MTETPVEPRVAAPCWRCYLLDVSLGKGQLSGDVEHDLPLPEHSEDRLGSGLAVSHIQASTETARPQRGEEGEDEDAGGGEEVLYVNVSCSYRTLSCLHGSNATTVLLPFEVLQGDGVSQDTQELLERRRLFVVAKQLFLRRLAETHNEQDHFMQPLLSYRSTY